jgi:hypothetical protein
LLAHLDRPAATHYKKEGTTMNSVTLLVNAARNRDRNMAAEGAKIRPRNCHEAVLGWLLLSLNYPRPWALIRLYMARYKTGGHTPQADGPWMHKYIYGDGMPVDQKNLAASAKKGDILYSGSRRDGTHSMVVVYNNDLEVLIRGFNNAGTFRGCEPPPPELAYDDMDRRVDGDDMWTGGRFAMDADLFLVSHQAARMNVAKEFAWEGSAIPPVNPDKLFFFSSNRWHGEFPYG